MSDLAQRIASLSPEKLALLASRLKKKSADGSRTRIPRRTGTGPIPVSFAQQRLWFIDQLEPNSPLYNIPGALRLTGSLNVKALERSLNEVVRRHEALRTTFAVVDAQPVQVISPELALPVPVVDLCWLPQSEREAKALQLATEEARRPFDLAHGPLVRAGLLKLAHDEHVLLLTLHHIISDGWSLGVLVREVAALYAAFSEGKPSPLPELPIQYADFGEWQRGWLQGERLEKQLAYWRQQLGGDLPILQLPTDHPRLAVQSYQGAHYSFTLPRQLAESLVALSRQEGATLFMTLLAAFQTLLYRYTGQEDICVGAPIANRTQAEIEGLIGFFVNTLVMRTDLSGAPTFRELLKRVCETALGAYAHQDLPFEMLVDALRPERDTSYSPLFRVALGIEQDLLETMRLGSLKLNLLNVETGTAKFGLTLIVTEGADSLRGTFEYNSDLFEADTIRRMAGHFQMLLEGIIANPDQCIATLPLLTQAERHQLLVEWNDTTIDYPQDQCVHQLFEAQAERTPDAVAVASGEEQLTYRALNRRANQLAHHLQKLGVGPETLVGICAERSPEMIVGVVGVLKAGGAYVPMDPSYPSDRLAYMLQDSQASVLLTQQRLVPHLPAHEGHVICLDTDWPDIAQGSEDNRDGGATARNRAYVIYTSGSTGKPKGVEVEHGGLLNLVFWTRRLFKVSPLDRTTQIAGPGFDASVWEVWPYLTAGASIHIPDDETRVSPVLLRDWLIGQAITTTFLPTPLAESVLALDWPDGLALRVVQTGGDKLHVYPSPSVPFDLVNNYGPTEDTVVTTSGRVSPKECAESAPSLGRPIDNTQVYILDAHLQPVPIGVPGEIYIGGHGLARGYLNRPDLTAERFVRDPFSDQPEARLYRTGDLARYLPNGEIEFTGRLDHQVKIRGFRIELGEIEAVLGEHPSVRECIVLAWEDVPGDKRLVAYIVSHHQPAPDAGELRDFLLGKLPAYMVPSSFVKMDALPLTPNGKVDRRALPAPDLSQFELEKAYVAPGTPVEEMLAGIWAQVLGVDRVGVHDSFFELGGHSLLATQIVSRLRDAFQVELPLRSLFETPTVGGLAKAVEIARRTTSGLAALPVHPVSREGNLPLSFAQQRLWFLDQLEPNSPLYNIPAAVRVTGTLNVTALEQALNGIVRRHESLRTVFALVDGQPIQVIRPEFALTLPVTDLSDMPRSLREAEALQLATEEARRPFDLVHGPLVRGRLLRLAEQDHIVLWTTHHIVSDGWSIGVLIREVAELYEAFVADKPSPLRELPIQYADFAAWQRQWLQGEMLEAQLSYWKQQLKDTPTFLDMPTDRPRSAVQGFQGALYSFVLPQPLSKSVKVLAQGQGATLFMVLLAAFQTLLYRYSGQEDICVGMPIANRNRAEIEGLIGFFVNTLVLRGDLSGDPSFRELLKRVREVTLGAYAHQDLPFEKLVDALQPQRDLSHTPLFQVMLVLQNAPAPPLELSGLTLRPIRVDTGIATFDLTLTVEDTLDGLACEFEYSTDLFDAATIAAMARHLQSLLESVVADPDQHVSILPLLTQAERQVLVDWNDTATDLPENMCIHQLIEAQVERSLDAIAVVLPATEAHPAKHLTYRELNQRANCLAHQLRKLGVGPETLVGLCVERSLEMVVGLLGILKAGGAYLPLDPTYPPERLAFMLQDSQAPVLLTQSRFLASLSCIIPLVSCEVVCLDIDWPVIAQQSDENPVSNVAPENLAYVIYTSGSTGQPKGVPVEHRGVVNHNIAVARAFQLQPSDRVFQFATINFDAAAEEMYPAWMSGATVVLRPEGPLATGAEFSRLIEAEQVSVLDLPTAYWHEWVYELSLLKTPVPACMRLLVLGGEKAEAARMTLWQQAGGAAIRWLNTYGPTEGTIIATLYDPAHDGNPDRRELPIGRPIANTLVRLLDNRLQPVPVGVAGELHIGGLSVARGYLNRPELTAEKFIPDPFSRLPGARLYKTGDLARYRPDGNIEFLGRADRQIKVRGFRVELGEIEAALGQHAGVRQAVVLARDEVSGKRLVAYVVPTDERLAARDQAAIVQPSSFIGGLREFLKSKLPEYMLPSAFVMMEALPLSPSGKVDRQALPAPETRPELEGAYVSPRTREEETLAGIWAQVLGVTHVGIHDNFFELGGDSILSIQVIARANQAGLHLTPRQLFEHPTVAGLAAVAGTAQIVQAGQGIVEGPVRLTPIQRWFFEQDFPEPYHWNQAVLLEAREPLDPALLEASVEHLLTHHDALRLRFVRKASGWQATNAGVGGAVPFERIDLSTLPEANHTQTIEAYAADLQASLNLSEGPLMRVAYFDLGAGRPGRLLMIIHHLVVDGVSWRILFEDLQTTYGQLSRGEPVRLPPKTTSFQYWSKRLAEYAHSEAAQQELSYWLVTLPVHVDRLPVDYVVRRAANTEASAHTVTVSLQPVETQALLKEVPAAYGTEINDVLMTALVQASARWTGSRTLLVDLEGHGREDILEDVDISRTVGWFTTTFPVRLDLSDAQGLGEALKTVKEQLRRAPQHGIGYGVLRYLCDDVQVAEQLQALPQPEITFNYLGQLDQALPESAPFRFAHEPIGPSRSLMGQRGHVIEINGVVVEGRLQIEWTYSENLHRRTTVEGLAFDFVEALRSLIAHCQSPEAGGYTPSDFPDVELSQADIEALVGEIGAA